MKYVNNNLFLFTLLILFTFFLGFVFFEVIDINRKTREYLIGNFSVSQINELINFREKWKFFSYLMVPVNFILKITLIVSVLYVGTFFYSKTKVTFKQLFNAVVKAEFIF